MLDVSDKIKDRISYWEDERDKGIGHINHGIRAYVKIFIKELKAIEKLIPTQLSNGRDKEKIEVKEYEQLSLFEKGQHGN